MTTKTKIDLRSQSDESLGYTASRWHLMIAALWVIATIVGLQAFSGGAKQAVLAVTTVEQLSNSLVVGPLSAFAFGWLATVCLQSSSVVTSAAVGLVLAGMPLNIAVPVILGANVGTTVTCALVASFWAPQWGAGQQVRSVAWVHVLANAVTMPLFFLWIFLLPQGNPLLFASSFTAWLVEHAPAPVSGDWLWSWQAGLDTLYTRLTGEVGVVYPIIKALLGLLLVVVALHRLSVLLRRYLAVGAERLLLLSVTASSWRAYLVGIFLSVAFVSSSVVTCMLLPMAASGLLTARRATAVIMGANLGTTLTALSVAWALSDERRHLALQLACVHVWVNVVMTLIVVMSLPLQRWLAHAADQCTAWVDRRHRPRLLALLQVALFFVALPLLCLVSVFVLWA